MTITRVQGNEVNSSTATTSQAITLGSGITQGNLVVAAVASGGNTTTITGPSGWTQAVINQPAGSNATIEASIWYLVVGSGQAGQTSWTFTFSASHTVYLCISEWSATNGWQASPLDVTATGDTSGSPTQATTIVSGTTATTAQASELWIASLAYKGSAQTESSVTSGWTSDLEATLTSNNTLTMLYKVASSTGAASCQYTIGSGAYWAGCVATFKPVIATTNSRTVPATVALTNTLSRTAPASIALMATGISRTAPATISLANTLSRTAPATISLVYSSVFYASNVASTIGGLTLSDQMAMTNGGTETSVAVTMPSSGSNSYVELLSQGGVSSGTPVLPSPTGNGWSVALQGNMIPAGSWSSLFTLAKSGTAMTGAALYVRWYRRTIDGIYYLIGSTSLTGQTFSTKAVYALPSVVASLWQFIDGDVLYMDCFAFNGSTAWSSDVFTVYVSSSATQGVVSDGTITTPQMITTPSELSCLIGSSNFQSGSGISVRDQSFTLADAIDQRSILTLTGEDSNGSLSYQRGMPVMLSDHDAGLLYTGYVNSDKVSKPTAGNSSAQLEHALTFMDHHYDADKRANTTNYLNWSAGDMVADFIAQTLSQEGITGAFALESDYSPATFGTGTLSGTVATTTTSSFTYAPNTLQPPITSNTGDLELVRAGAQFTLTETVTADFASGTLTNMVASNNELTPTTQSAIKFQVQVPVNTVASNTGSSAIDATHNTQEVLGNSAYAKIWSGSMTVGSSDTLNYDIWIASSSPAYLAAVDLTFSDGTLLSSYAYGTPDSLITSNGDTGLWDQNNTSADFITDLSNYAKDAWYTRQIALTGLNGKTITGVSLAVVGSAAGVYTVYIKNCYLGSHSGSPFFSTSATVTQVNPVPITCAGGYVAKTGVVSVVNVFRPANSTRISPAHSISGVGLVQNSTITWTASLPTSGTASVVYPPGTSAASSGSTGAQPAMLIYVSYDATTWLLCANQQALPGLPPGANVAGLSLYLMEQFQAGSDPTAIPSLEQVQITINSAAAQTTTDVVAAYGNATAWNTGTYSGTTTNSNGDLINGGTYAPAWTTGSTFDWTMEQTGSHANLSFTGGTLTISDTGDSGANNLVVSFDDVAPLVNGIIECDVSTSSAGTNQWSRTGLIYRAGDWHAGFIGGSSTPGNQYDPIMNGYVLYIQADTVNSTMFVAVVPLSSTGAPSFSAGFNTTISQGTTYHLKVVFENNRHTVYFNHSSTPSIDFLDNTYIGAGGVGVYSMGTNGGSTNSQATSHWSNYTLTPLGNGSWQSAAISLSSLGTCGYTQISWSEQGENGYSQSTAIVLASIDGGANWRECTNGAEIPQLPVGTSVSGASLLIQIILFTSTYITTPAIMGLYARICGNYGTVSGTRISPALNLSPVGYIASSNVMWNANIPTSTSLTVQTTQDLSTFHTVNNNGAGESLPYWTVQPQATQDLFSSDTSANYTATGSSGTYALRVFGGTIPLGGATTWTDDTANSRLIATGGSDALYLNNAITMADVDLLCDMDESDAGGLVWRYVDANDFYELECCDASSSSGFTNQLRLYKIASGTRSLLGSASSITFTRGTFHRIRVTMESGLINVYFDGQCMQSYLDTSPLGAGQCGLRNDGGTSR
jgi:hypothetical protein